MKKPSAGAAFALRVLAFALVYFAAGRLGLSLAFSHENVSPVWPPTGVALAGLLIGGPRYWPAIFIGSFSVNALEFWANGTGAWWVLLPSLGIACGNTLESVVGVALFRRYYEFQGSFASDRALAWGAFSMAVVGVPISATMGVGVLCLSSSAACENFWQLWTTWWTGDLAGAAIVMPAIAVWFDGQVRVRRGGRAAIEALLLLAVLVFVCALVFGDMGLPPGESPPLIYLLLPVLILTVLRFGQRGGVVTVLIGSALAIEATLEGRGPFALASANDSLLFLQTFMIVIAGTSMFMAAVLEQRDRLARAVCRQNSELERHVQDRTVELCVANAQLKEQADARKAMAEEQLVMERRALEGQKLESLGVLTGGIAHDFNNLLVPILGYASLARAKLPSGAAASQDLDKIVLSANRAASLVRQLLVYAGKARMTMEAVSINAIVEEIDELLSVSTPKHVTTRLELDKNLPRANADVAQMTQVVLNLLRNATDAIGDSSGEVHIRTRMMDVDSAMLAGCVGGAGIAPGEYLCLEVADTGCGMDEATRAHVFEPFFSTKEEGRGLGLSAILGIIRSHGGGIFIETAPEKGTTMRVILPPYGEVPKERAPAAKPSQVQAHGTVLVVDDDSQVRSFTGEVLKRMGIDVVEARDGDEALERFAEYEDVLTAVVLDLTMPRRSGAAVLEAIRVRAPGLPVVLVSGYPDSETLAQVDADRAACFLQKPYPPDKLWSTLLNLAIVAAQP